MSHPLAISRVEYTTEGTGDEKRAVLHIIGRDENNERIVKQVRDFEPYFYVEPQKVPSLPQIKETVKGFSSFFGKALWKVVCHYPAQVRKAREHFINHYEADILFDLRYLIDEVDDLGELTPVVMAVDIEVDARTGFPSPAAAAFPITSVSAVDNLGNKHLFIWRKDFKDNTINAKSAIIHRFSQEPDMIKALAEHIRTTWPDILTGWNFVLFDMYYLYNRTKNLGLDPSMFSPLDSFYVRKSQSSGKWAKKREGTFVDVVLKGIAILDALVVYRRLHKGELHSYSLNHVAQEELGRTKLDIPQSTGYLWENDPKTLLKYNLIDSELVLDILEHGHIIEFLDELRRFAFVNWEDTMMLSRLVDTYILRACRRRNLGALPSKGAYTEGKRTQGATVLVPSPGIHHWTAVGDIDRQYPTIMVAFNMSPETLDPHGDLEVGNGVRFRSEPAGLIPRLLRDMFEARENKKKEIAQVIAEGVDSEESKNKIAVLKQQETVIKYFTNAYYGYFGYTEGRLYRHDIFRSVTYIGRKLTEWNIKFLKDRGYEAIYGDTDSIFFKVPAESESEAEEKSNKVLEELEKSYDDFADEAGLPKHEFKIKLDKLYRRILFAATSGDSERGVMKRYAGMKPSGELEVTGFEMIRQGDTAKISMKLQKEVLTSILSGEPFSETKDRIRRTIADIRSGKCSAGEIGIPQRLNKDPRDYKSKVPKLRGIEYANKYLGTTIMVGDKPKMVYVKSTGPKYPPTDVVCFIDGDAIPNDFCIDYDKMIQKVIKLKLERILEAAGHRWSEISGPRRLI